MNYQPLPPHGDELRALATDVWYEVEMLAVAISRISDIAGHDREGQDADLQIDRNAWVESMLVHVRNVIGFFDSKPQMPTVT